MTYHAHTDHLPWQHYAVKNHSKTGDIWIQIEFQKEGEHRRIHIQLAFELNLVQQPQADKYLLNFLCCFFIITAAALQPASQRTRTDIRVAGFSQTYNRFVECDVVLLLGQPDKNSSCKYRPEEFLTGVGAALPFTLFGAIYLAGRTPSAQS